MGGELTLEILAWALLAALAGPYILGGGFALLVLMFGGADD